jgi:glycosyltransferase involved in cell wall biosynthesis
MKPFLSVVVVTYNMNRELPRTLLSLSPGYQRDIDAHEYEVIVVDNGSAVPPTAAEFSHLGIDLTVVTMPDPRPSPVAAVNHGLDLSVGAIVGVYIDGARIASPGLLAEARSALEHDQRAFVGARGRYLGPELQRDSMTKGYHQRSEDLLLMGTHWEDNGYRLFDVSVWDESSSNAWFGQVAESNAVFMWRRLWRELEGYDPAFASPGGGLVNLDTWRRACMLPDTRPTLLLGEATFHQFHGGVATNGPVQRIDGFFDEFRELRGHAFALPEVELRFWGTFHWSPTASASWDNLHTARYMRREQRTHRVKDSARVVGRHLPRPAKRSLRELARFGRMAAGGHLSAWRQERAAAAEIRASDLFDAAWYLGQYPDVAASGYDPATHYARLGLLQHRQPGPEFDALWYLEHHREAMQPGQNPLLHYLRIGNAAGLRIKPVVDQPVTIPG